MAAFDPSTTAFLTIHNMVTWMVGNWGVSVAAHKGLCSAAAPARVYCLTEPDAGSDAGSLQTQRPAARCRLRSEWFQGLYFRRRRYRPAGGHGAHRRAGPRRCLPLWCRPIPASAMAAKKKMGWNQSTRPITFENGKIPADHLLGEEGQGLCSP